MNWTVRLVAEAEPGLLVEQEVITIEHEYLFSPVTVGLTVAEGKAMMESLQREIVPRQVQHLGTGIRACSQCGNAFGTNGYYQSTLRSVYAKIPVRVRRLRGSFGMGAQRRSYSMLFTNKNPITPALKYLTAKNGGFISLW